MDKIYCIVFLALLLSFLIFKELGRKNKSNLRFRLTASVLAIISLVFILYPIKYDRKVSLSNSTIAILLTEGYSKDSLDKWKGATLFSTNKAITEKDNEVQYINDITYFLRQGYTINRRITSDGERTGIDAGFDPGISSRL